MLVLKKNQEKYHEIIIAGFIDCVFKFIYQIKQFADWLERGQKIDMERFQSKSWSEFSKRSINRDEYQIWF